MSNDADEQSFVEQYLTRRRMLAGAAAAGAVALGFAKTREIQAQQLTGNSLYDQLGGLVGISAVIQTFVGLVAADTRINSFFAGTVANKRVPHLQEMLIQQVANATGGPVTYTGADMKTVHAGLGITTAAFTALVEDLSMALDQNKVPDGPKTMLLNALAPLQSDIVEIP
jgi:hemoglobin